MRRVLSCATALAIAVSGPASALSCIQRTLHDDYNAIDQSPDEYVVAVGSLSRTGPNVPSGDAPAGRDRADPAGYAVPARFVGNFLAADGFTDQRDVAVRINVICLGPWCGGAALAEYALVFLRREGPGVHVFDAGPCGGFFYQNPTDHQLLEVIGCHQNGGC